MLAQELLTDKNLSQAISPDSVVFSSLPGTSLTPLVSDIGTGKRPFGD
jgi:hypothetical protein